MHFTKHTTIMMPITSIRPILCNAAIYRTAFQARPLVRPFAAVQTRCYARQSPIAPTLEVFNSHTKYLQKERAAQNVEESRQVDYMRDEVATRLAERLLVCECPLKGTIFPSCHEHSPDLCCRTLIATFQKSSTSVPTPATLPASSPSQILTRQKINPPPSAPA